MKTTLLYATLINNGNYLSMKNTTRLLFFRSNSRHNWNCVFESNLNPINRFAYLYFISFYFILINKVLPFIWLFQNITRYYTSAVFIVEGGFSENNLFRLVIIKKNDHTNISYIHITLSYRFFLFCTFLYLDFYIIIIRNPLHFSK